MPEDKITLSDLREDSEEALAAMPATVSNKELETVVAIGSMAAVTSFVDHIRKEQRFNKPFAKHLFPDLGKVVAQAMQTEFNQQRWILKPQTKYIKHYLDTYGLSKIKDLSETTIEGLRQSLEINIMQGVDPRVASRMIRPQIGLTARQSAAVNRRYFKMLEDGIRPDIARARAQRHFEHLLKYRADTIARTELNAAKNHGLLESWNEAGDRGLYDKATSTKEWIASATSCDACIDLDGERVRLDQPFSAGIMSPPLHPRGTCGMGLKQNTEPTAPRTPPVVSKPPVSRPLPPPAPPEPIPAKPAIPEPTGSKALAEYQNYGYSEVNGQLRSGTISPEVQRKVKAIDKLYADVDEKTIYAFRGDGASLSSELFGDVKEMKGIRFGYDDLFTARKAELEKALTTRLKGVEFTDNAFLSASASKAEAMKGFVPGSYDITRYGGSGLVEISGKAKFLDVNAITGVESLERELLLPRGTRLRIQSVKLMPHPDGKRVYLHWKVEVARG